jgi:hypothetical protein
MSNNNKCIVDRDNRTLQIPYADYVALMEKVKEGKRLRLVKDSVIVSLQSFMGGTCHVAEVSAKIANARTDIQSEPVQAKTVVKPAAKAPASNGRSLPEGVNVPPIKKDVSVHFNSVDDSGRLFSVFKQYYACLNDACGGTVRVTLKDGFCSLWNYDEWEEFAYIDIFEGQLRIALNPRYTEALQSLNLCEVPRLLSSRMNLVCVQVDGLNNTMLDVLVKAFEEVGLTAN